MERQFYDAIYIGDLNKIKQLIKKININKLYYGYSYLYYAYQHKKIKIIKYLIKHGANINILNYYDDTLLFTACQNNDYKMIKYLIKHNANINITNNHKMTPLMIIIINKPNAFKIIKLLLKHNADTTILSAQHCNALDMALNTKNYKVIELLLQYNAKNSSIIYIQNDITIRLLIQYGVIKNYFIQNEYKYLIKERHDDIIKYLTFKEHHLNEIVLLKID